MAVKDSSQVEGWRPEVPQPQRGTDRDDRPERDGRAGRAGGERARRVPAFVVSSQSNPHGPDARECNLSNV